MRLSQATDDQVLNIMGKKYVLDYSIRAGGGKICVKRVDNGECCLMPAGTECDLDTNFQKMLGIKEKTMDDVEIETKDEEESLSSGTILPNHIIVGDPIRIGPPMVTDQDIINEMKSTQKEIDDKKQRELIFDTFGKTLEQIMNEPDFEETVTEAKKALDERKREEKDGEFIAQEIRKALDESDKKKKKNPLFGIFRNKDTND